MRLALRLTDDTALTATGTPLITPRVAGGLYLSSNTDVRALLPAARSATRYVSIDQTGPAMWSGWIDAFARGGGWVNLVVELKCYGTGAVQSFTVEGRTYEGPAYQVPAADGAIQLGSVLGAGVPAYSYRQITSAACDGLKHRLLAALRPALAAGARINIQLASEVDTDNQWGVRYQGGPIVQRVDADVEAVAAYTHLINWLRDPPAGIVPVATAGLTFTLGWAGQWSGKDAFNRCHPDTLPVDYLSFNSYNRSANWNPIDRLTETAAYRSTSRQRRLDILIGEWGTSATHAGGQAAYIRQWPAAVQSFNAAATAAGTGRILMTNYFGSRDATWGLLSPAADGLAALAAAYTTSPYLPRRPA
jgi:hypothetical protein